MAKTAIVLVTAGLFVAIHYPAKVSPALNRPQLPGSSSARFFAVTGQLWMLICAHAAFDLTAVAIIYWNVEAKLAHLLFQ